MVYKTSPSFRCCNGVRLTCSSQFAHDNGAKLIAAFLFIALMTAVLVIVHIEHTSRSQMYLVEEPSATGNSVAASDSEPTDLSDESLSYGIIFDCGSSGTRVYIYCWPPHDGFSRELLKIRQVIGADGKPRSMKVSPGLSTYNKNATFSAEYLRPLLDFAAGIVPTHKHKSTPLYIMATAGMRLIDQTEAKRILNDIVLDIPTWYDFEFTDSHAQVIQGEEEGMYAWISLNYMLGKLSSTEADAADTSSAASSTLYSASGDLSSSGIVGRKHHGSHMDTVGVVDMGGGSLQIAFEVKRQQDIKDNKYSVNFNLGFDDDDDTFSYHLYTSTFLGFGANSALDRYRENLASGHISNDNESAIIKDPCMALGSTATFSRQTGEQIHLNGSGDVAQCMKTIKSLLNLDKQCHYDPCSIDGVHQPTIPALSSFYGISEYWYSVYDVLSINSYYNPDSITAQAQKYCQTPWTVTMDRYNKNIYPHADMARMTNQCFKVSWVLTALYDGLRFPADFKSFLPVSEIRGQEVQWSLGALIHKTRYLPLKYRSITHIGHPYTFRMVPYALLACIVVVCAAILLYCRRLQKMSMKSVPSMSYFMTSPDQAEMGLLNEKHYFN